MSTDIAFPSSAPNSASDLRPLHGRYMNNSSDVSHHSPSLNPRYIYGMPNSTGIQTTSGQHWNGCKGICSCFSLLKNVTGVCSAWRCNIAYGWCSKVVSTHQKQKTSSKPSCPPPKTAPLDHKSSTLALAREYGTKRYPSLIIIASLTSYYTNLTFSSWIPPLILPFPCFGRQTLFHFHTHTK